MLMLFPLFRILLLLTLATYRILTELGFDHHMVNHSIELVSREGVHTNHIEGI